MKDPESAIEYLAWFASREPTQTTTSKKDLFKPFSCIDQLITARRDIDFKLLRTYKFILSSL